MREIRRSERIDSNSQSWLQPPFRRLSSFDYLSIYFVDIALVYSGDGRSARWCGIVEKSGSTCAAPRSRRHAPPTRPRRRTARLCEWARRPRRASRRDPARDRRRCRAGVTLLLRKPLNSNRMTKQQLIEKVATKTELGKTEAAVAVDSVLDLIADALRSNERVDLRGFGTFVVKERKERQGRNPRTGETITIAAKRDATFKPGKELTEKLAHAETASPVSEEAP